MAKLQLDLVIGQGWQSIQTHLKTATENTKKFGTDLDRLAGSAKQVNGLLAAMGASGLLSLGAIAALSPSLAGAMAKIEIATYKIAESIGKELKPAFDWFANSMMGVSEFLNNNEWARKLTADLLLLGTVVSAGGALIGGLKSLWGWLTGLGSLGRIVITIAVIYEISQILKEFITPERNEQMQGVAEAFGPLKPVAEVAGNLTYGTIGLLESMNAGQAILDWTPLGGLVKGISTGLSPLLGTNQYSATDILSNLFGAGGQMVNILITDQNGQTRDYIVAQQQ